MRIICEFFIDKNSFEYILNIFAPVVFCVINILLPRSSIYSTRKKTFNCHIRMSCFILCFMTECYFRKKRFESPKKTNIHTKTSILVKNGADLKFMSYCSYLHIHLPQAANNYHAARTGRYIDSQGRFAEKP